MRRYWRSRKGQSILEYLVIATIIVIALIAIRPVLQGNINKLFNTAASQTGTADASLAGTKAEVAQ